MTLHQGVRPLSLFFDLCPGCRDPYTVGGRQQLPRGGREAIFQRRSPNGSQSYVIRFIHDLTSTSEPENKGMLLMESNWEGLGLLGRGSNQ